MLNLLSDLITLFIVFLVIAAITTWIPDAPGTSLSSAKAFFAKATAPIYAPVRQLVPPIQGRLDISPMIVILGLMIIRGLL